MGIMGMFRNIQPPRLEPVVGNPAVTGNPTVPDPSVLDPTKTTSPAAIPAPAEGSKSPLDAFKDLWQADNARKPTSQSLIPDYQMDPAKIAEISKTVDFTGHFTQDQVTKALSGDMAAFRAVINGSVQAAFAKSTEVTGEVVKQALTQQAKAIEAMVPGILQRERVSSLIDASNPIFTNPATAPMLELVKNQFVTKYPTASAQEVEQHARAFVSSFAQTVVEGNGQKVVDVPKAAKNAPKEIDWLNFATQDTPSR